MSIVPDATGARGLIRVGTTCVTVGAILSWSEDPPVTTVCSPCDVPQVVALRNKREIGRTCSRRSMSERYLESSGAKTPNGFR